jgi:hypothetical protein
MANTAIKVAVSGVTIRARAETGTEAQPLDRVSSAFALSASVAIVFNTVLAWIKDAYEPLNKFMASLTGHHWTTHGLFDIAVFVILGLVFLQTGIASRMNPMRLVYTLVGSVVVAGLGLAAWFVLF